MKIGIVLVHNKGELQNQAQIEFFKSLLTLNSKTDPVFSLVDGVPTQTGTATTYFYTLNDLKFEHEVKFYQIVPYGVMPPANLYSLDSYKVFYARGDEDKTGDHPRFFNWGLKRATDHGNEIVLYLEDFSKLVVKDLPFFLNTLIDPNSKLEYVKNESVKIGTITLLKKVGQMAEDKTLSEAAIDYEQKLIEKGFEKNG